MPHQLTVIIPTGTLAGILLLSLSLIIICCYCYRRRKKHAFNIHRSQQREGNLQTERIYEIATNENVRPWVEATEAPYGIIEGTMNTATPISDVAAIETRVYDTVMDIQRSDFHTDQSSYSIIQSITPGDDSSDPTIGAHHTITTYQAGDLRNGASYSPQPSLSEDGANPAGVYDVITKVQIRESDTKEAIYNTLDHATPQTQQDTSEGYDTLQHVLKIKPVQGDSIYDTITKPEAANTRAPPQPVYGSLEVANSVKYSVLLHKEESKMHVVEGCDCRRPDVRDTH